MPIIQSAFRRVKRSEIQASVNRVRKSKYKAAIKQMSSFIAAGKTKDAIKFLPKFHSQLMKVAKTGVIRKETASRKISRAMKKIKNLKK